MPLPDNSRTIRPLFVSRPLLNQDDLIKWAVDEGFRELIPAADMHVTIALDLVPVDWQRLPACNNHLQLRPRGRRLVRRFGGVAVLTFGCRALAHRHTEFRRIGMKWNYPTYQPHVSFAIDADLDISAVKPYTGPLHFGAESFREPFDDFIGNRRRIN